MSHRIGGKEIVIALNGTSKHISFKSTTLRCSLSIDRSEFIYYSNSLFQTVCAEKQKAGLSTLSLHDRHVVREVPEVHNNKFDKKAVQYDGNDKYLYS